MPVADTVAATVAEDNQHPFTDPMPARNPHGSSAALRATRRSHATLWLHGEALPHRPVTNRSLFAPGTRSARFCAFLKARRASERKGTRVRGLGGGAIDGAPSCASYGRESERSDGETRAREGRQGLSFILFTFTLGALGAFSRKRGCARMGRVAACEVRCVRDVRRTRAVHPAAVLTRLRGEAGDWGAGVTSSVARDVLVLYASKWLPPSKNALERYYSIQKRGSGCRCRRAPKSVFNIQLRNSGTIRLMAKTTLLYGQGFKMPRLCLSDFSYHIPFHTISVSICEVFAREGGGVREGHVYVTFRVFPHSFVHLLALPGDAAEDALKIPRVQNIRLLQCASIEQRMPADLFWYLFDAPSTHSRSEFRRPTPCSEESISCQSLRGDAYNAFILLPAIFAPLKNAEHVYTVWFRSASRGYSASPAYSLLLHLVQLLNQNVDHASMVLGGDAFTLYQLFPVLFAGRRNASPLRANGLFHAGSSTSDSKALGGNLRSVYVSSPAERAAH
ncbi:hypothetical protein FB451DRAFT_1190037 [Mycena latifolia]|nr:hypothetical protein FB451DRAFT_1190037 [Mycena latifolia]